MVSKHDEIIKVGVVRQKKPKKKRLTEYDCDKSKEAQDNEMVDVEIKFAKESKKRKKLKRKHDEEQDAAAVFLESSKVDGESNSEFQIERSDEIHTLKKKRKKKGTTGRSSDSIVKVEADLNCKHNEQTEMPKETRRKKKKKGKLSSAPNGNDCQISEQKLKKVENNRSVEEKRTEKKKTKTIINHSTNLQTQAIELSENVNNPNRDMSKSKKAKKRDKCRSVEVYDEGGCDSTKKKLKKKQRPGSSEKAEECLKNIDSKTEATGDGCCNDNRENVHVKNKKKDKGDKKLADCESQANSKLAQKKKKSKKLKQSDDFKLTDNKKSTKNPIRQNEISEVCNNDDIEEPAKKKQKTKSCIKESSTNPKLNETGESQHVASNPNSQKTGLGQWANTDLQDTARQDKFFRLLGGKKKQNSSLASNRFSSLACNYSQTKKLNDALENQFNTTLAFNLQKRNENNKSKGLGFTEDPAKGKKFYIDIHKSNSVKFE